MLPYRQVPDAHVGVYFSGEPNGDFQSMSRLALNTTGLCEQIGQEQVRAHLLIQFMFCCD